MTIYQTIESIPDNLCTFVSSPQIARFLELAGVAIIVGGTLIAGFVFVYSGLTTGGWRAAYEQCRSNLGRGILLGLAARCNQSRWRCVFNRAAEGGEDLPLVLRLSLGGPDPGYSGPASSKVIGHADDSTGAALRRPEAGQKRRGTSESAKQAGPAVSRKRGSDRLDDPLCERRRAAREQDLVNNRKVGAAARDGEGEAVRRAQGGCGKAGGVCRRHGRRLR